MKQRTDRRLEALFELARAGRRPVLLDGAMGTELDNRSVPTDSPVWSGLAPLTASDIIQKIHREYVEAGADIVTTCTFRTTGRAYARANIQNYRWQDAASKAVELARRAASDRALIAGSIGPLEDCFLPGAAPSEAESHKEHQQLARLLDDENVDLFLIETMGTLRELSGALAAVREVSHKPCIVSVTTLKHGTLLSGESLLDAVKIAAAHGASAVCINCVPPRHLDEPLAKLATACTLPCGFYANLGFADPHQDWTRDAHLSPPAYADLGKKWFQKGVALIGGCCGSSPAHIAALADCFRFEAPK